MEYLAQGSEWRKEMDRMGREDKQNTERGKKKERPQSHVVAEQFINCVWYGKIQNDTVMLVLGRENSNTV